MMQISSHLDEIEEKLTEITYNVLCSERLTQMTKTYNDVEAVTRLLEEKERDLELAARIGQTLLEKNKSLEERNDSLEELIAAANERIAQLRHELAMKDELINIYTQSYESHESSPEPVGGDPHGDTLQRKIKSLEDENLKLHLETTHLKATTDSLEEKEQKLVNDCVHQLDDARQQLELFARELSDKTEECSNQKEEITSFLSQIVTLQKKNRTLTVENLELQKTLEAAHDSQNYLTREIAELKEKNEELLLHLEENQEEVRRLRSRCRPTARQHMSPSLLPPGDSLASELESSLRGEIEYPRGYSPMDRRRHTWKIFETAKAAKAASASGSSMLGPGSTCNLSGLGTSGVESATDSQSVSQRSSMYFSDAESGVSDGYSGDMESLYGSGKKLGRPGIPGSHDLQRALRRLSMRRANELNEMDFAREERDRQLRERTVSEATDAASMQETNTPTRCRTPDSLISGGSGYISMTGSSGNPYFRMPEKLRIVKPLEGSVTLRHWQRLATPHLGNLFETQPGVQIKGETPLEVQSEVYTLSDYEEDDDEMVDYPVRFQESSGVYTFTNSTVRHPSEAASEEMETDSVKTLTDEETSSSFTSSTPRMAISSSGAQGSGTSTFSMSLGLASLLNERDLLVTPPEGTPNAAHRPSVVSSNPARFPSLISDTHFQSHTVSPSALTLPTNNYSLIASPSTMSQRSQKVGEAESNLEGSRSDTVVNQNAPSTTSAPSLSPNSLSGALSMINKLKNSGLTMYGYFSGGLTSPEGQGHPATSRPDTLPLTSTVSSVPASAVTMSAVSASTATESLVTAGTTSESPKKRTLTSLLSGRTAGGVMGALTRIKRDANL